MPDQHVFAGCQQLTQKARIIRNTYVTNWTYKEDFLHSRTFIINKEVHQQITKTKKYFTSCLYLQH